jgi:hypothetical protein
MILKNDSTEGKNGKEREQSAQRVFYMSYEQTRQGRRKGSCFDIHFLGLHNLPARARMWNFPAPTSTGHRTASSAEIWRTQEGFVFLEVEMT